MERVTRKQQLFRRDGDYWTIAFEGQLVRLRDARGLRYLATLLQHPGEPMPAEVLVAFAGSPGRASLHEAPRAQRLAPPGPEPHDGDRIRLEAERARVTVTKGIKHALVRLADVHPTLAQHLAVTVKRGYVCTYTPDPRAPTHWRE